MLARIRNMRGFTLIEMVTVIVLLGIIAGLLTPFIAKSLEAYTHSKARASLVARGRLAMERLAREVRLAIPNSLVVLSGGTGIEFLRSRTGGRYVERFDGFGAEFANNTLRFRKNANMSGLYIVGTSLALAAGDLLVIGNTSPADLTDSPPKSVVALASVNTTNPAAWPAGDATPQGQILTFNTSRRFKTESPGKHYNIADQTVEVGLDGSSNLRWFSSSGLADYDGGVDWSGTDPSLTNGVTSVNFIYAPGMPQSTGVLRIDLTLNDAATGQTIQLYREIHVRNTP